MKFTVHCLVKDEDIWVKYALSAVLPYAQEIIVYDTGSTDKTVEQIKSIKSPKIKLEEKGEQDRRGLAKLRQEMVDKTKTEWFLIVDGDEIWPEKSLKKLIKTAESAAKNIVGIISPFRNSIGDVYHYLPDSTGNYQIAGRIGNITIRLMRKTKDLKLTGEYPLETFTNSNGPIQNQDVNLIFCDAWYMHNTFLVRSSSVSSKTSGSLGKQKRPERGIAMKDAELPEVFKEKPTVGDPLSNRGLGYELLALIYQPLISLKRGLRK